MLLGTVFRGLGRTTVTVASFSPLGRTRAGAGRRRPSPRNSGGSANFSALSALSALAISVTRGRPSSIAPMHPTVHLAASHYKPKACIRTLVDKSSVQERLTQALKYPWTWPKIAKFHQNPTTQKAGNSSLPSFIVEPEPV